jgi:hypothetical protein
MSVLKTSDDLADEINLAVSTLAVYPDYMTRAEILVPAIDAALVLYHRARCRKGPGRWLTLLTYLDLLCLRQFCLRVAWRNEGRGLGWTIWFWRVLGKWIGDVQVRIFRRALRDGVIRKMDWREP